MRTRRYLVLAVVAMLFSGVLDLASTLLCFSVPSKDGITAVELNPFARPRLLSGDVRHVYEKCFIPIVGFSLMVWGYHRSCKYNITRLRKIIEVFTLVYVLWFILVFINNIMVYAILLSW